MSDISDKHVDEQNATTGKRRVKVVRSEGADAIMPDGQGVAPPEFATGPSDLEEKSSLVKAIGEGHWLAWFDLRSLASAEGDSVLLTECDAAIVQEFSSRSAEHAYGDFYNVDLPEILEFHSESIPTDIRTTVFAFGEICERINGQPPLDRLFGSYVIEMKDRETAAIQEDPCWDKGIASLCPPGTTLWSNFLTSRDLIDHVTAGGTKLTDAAVDTPLLDRYLLEKIESMGRW